VRRSRRPQRWRGSGSSRAPGRCRPDGHPRGCPPREPRGAPPAGPPRTSRSPRPRRHDPTLTSQLKRAGPRCSRSPANEARSSVGRNRGSRPFVHYRSQAGPASNPTESGSPRALCGPDRFGGWRVGYARSLLLVGGALGEQLRESKRLRPDGAIPEAIHDRESGIHGRCVSILFAFGCIQRE
jgi:hypothetical protein